MYLYYRSLKGQDAKHSAIVRKSEVKYSILKARSAPKRIRASRCGLAMSRIRARGVMRTQWIEFISARTTRYLSPVIGDVERRDDIDLSERAVDEFLERLRGDVDLHLLASVYFLTQRRTSRFIGESLSAASPIG